MQASEQNPSRHPRRTFLKLFFHLLYQPLAWTYDWVAFLVSAGRWNDWIAETLRYISGPAVLELGHGPGHLQARLAAGGYTCFGIDRSRQMGRLAYHRLARRKLRPRLARADGRRLPFVSSSLNTVVATFPTEYIAYMDTNAEIHRVLAPGGTVVVLLSGWITGRTLHDRFLANLFQVTGQAQPLDTDFSRLLVPFQQHGFDARLEWVELPTSLLLIIVANKIPS